MQKKSIVVVAVSVFVVGLLLSFMQLRVHRAEEVLTESQADVEVGKIAIQMLQDQLKEVQGREETIIEGYEEKLAFERENRREQKERKK